MCLHGGDGGQCETVGEEVSTFRHFRPRCRSNSRRVFFAREKFPSSETCGPIMQVELTTFVRSAAEKKEVSNYAHETCQRITKKKEKNQQRTAHRKYFFYNVQKHIEPNFIINKLCAILQVPIVLSQLFYKSWIGLNF